MENNRPYVFICHSHEETDISMTKHLNSLETLLKRNNIDFFIDHSSIKSGSYWQKTLLDHLKKADAIIVFSNEKLANSAYCHMERGFAFALGIPEYIIFREQDKDIRLKEFIETQISQKIFFSPEWEEELVNFINEKKRTTTKPTPTTSRPEK